MKYLAGLTLVPLLAGRLVCVGQVAAVGPVSTPSFLVQAPAAETTPDSSNNPDLLPDSPDRLLVRLDPAETSAPVTAEPFNVSSSLDYTLPPAEPAANALVISAPVRRERRTADSRYLLLNGLELGLGLFDVAMTQHCIADHHCREGNPLMPSSLGGQLGINFGYAAYSSFISYKLKKRHSQFWFLAPTAGIAAHGVGVASGFQHY